MKKTRILARVLVLSLMLVILAGCGGTPAPGGTSSVPGGNSEPTAGSDGKFPNGTITIVVPWSAGGRGDTFARACANYMTQYLGVPVIVSNQPGGVGVTGSYAVAESAPDGYTLGSFATTHMFASYLKNPPFQPDSFIPVGGYAEIYEALVVKSDKKWNDLSDFIADAKSNPGKYLHGNTGVGQDDHIYAAALYAEQGLDIVQMPYDGDAGLTSALLSGEVDIAMIALPSVASYVESGEMKILAISSTERLEDLPDAPTFVEQGVDFTETAWTGLFAPAGTPDDVIAVLEEALDAVRNNPEYQATMKNMYVNVNYMDSKGLQSEIDRVLPAIQGWLDTLNALGVDLGI